MRRHRLVVRTPGSHPGNRGSIPLGGTTFAYYSSLPNKLDITNAIAGNENQIA